MIRCLYLIDRLQVFAVSLLSTYFFSRVRHCIDNLSLYTFVDVLQNEKKYFCVCMYVCMNIDDCVCWIA